MAHTVRSPLAKVLEGFWWWLENDAALQEFMYRGIHIGGVPNMFKVYDGSNMRGPDISVTECPALTIELTPTDRMPLSEWKNNSMRCPPSTVWSIDLYGFLNTLEFDIISEFFSLSLAAINKGLPTLFAVPSQGLLTGTDQIVSSVDIRDAVPGALWMNTPDITKGPRGGKPRVSFFVIGLNLSIDNAIGVITNV